MNFSYNRYKAFFTADFETSTEAWNIDKARVWLWDICDTKLQHINGTDIESFLNYISRFNNCLFSFHNLSYDGSYILYYLLEQGWEFTPNKELKPFQFTTLITPQNVHYVYELRFPNGNLVTINDSLKHNSMGVKRLANTYNLPIKKGEIDYDKVREIGHTPTEEELDYIHNDTEIVMRVLLEDLEHGFDKFTESGNSRKFFKKVHKKYYEDFFPLLSDDEDEYIRHSYRGGYCWLNPKHFNVMQGAMISLDINSMYPAQMLHKPLPYGEPYLEKGFAEDTKLYKLLKQHSEVVYIQHLTCSFTLRKNHVPTVAKKSFKGFSIKDLYLSDSGFKICEMWLTNVDLKLLFENYKVWDITYIDCYIFKAISGKEISTEQAKTMTVDEIIENDGIGSLYYNYLLPWRKQKEHTKGGQRERAKKMQNIAYGAQATSKTGDLVYPEIGENNLLHYKRYTGEHRKGGYIPIATFITAYSRELLITNILKNFDRFVYCDTDSLYLLGHELPDVPIHPTLYGYFKIEHIIDKAKFLGCKRYIYHTTKDSEDPDKTIVKCCGAPDGITNQMTFENFVPYDGINGVFEGKITAKIVCGGKHLIATTYKLIC